MKITDAIIAADRFMPNRFTLAEKLRWCNELSAMLSQEICKKYGSIECFAEDGALPALPDGINFEDIENVTVGGTVYAKSDLRSFEAPILPEHGENTRVRISYLEKYRPIRCIEMEGEYTVNNGFIGIVRPPFEVGDLIKIITEFDDSGEPNTSSAVYVYAVQIENEGIYVSDGLSCEGNVYMSLSRVITDETLAPMPYDVMYVEYLLSKYSSYSGDYDSYRSLSGQFNKTLDAYTAWYKARNPLSKIPGFHNYWR